MAQLDINIKLDQIVGAFSIPVKGKNDTKDCIAIPKDQLTVDRNGHVWLNITAYDDTRFEGQTHSLKQRLSKAQYDALPQRDGDPTKKVLTPYVGTIRTARQFTGGQSFNRPERAITSPDWVEPVPGDLPF